MILGDLFVWGMIVFLCALFVVGIVWLLRQTVGSRGAKQEQGEGTVVGKEYAAHSAPSHVMAGKAMIPTANHVSDVCTLLVRNEEGRGSIKVDRPFYDEISIGQAVAITYRPGKISGDLQIDSIEGIETRG